MISDTWFSSVKEAVAALTRNMEAIYKIKLNNRLYPKQFIKDALKEASSRTHRWTSISYDLI